MATRRPLRILQSSGRQPLRWTRTPRQVPPDAVSLFTPAVRTTGQSRTLSTTRSGHSTYWNRSTEDTDITAFYVTMALAMGVVCYSLDQIVRPARMRPHKLVHESLEMVAAHPAVAARLGSPLVFRDYDQEERGWNFQRKPKMEHLTLKDASDCLRLRVKFHVKGSYGPGVVFAEVRAHALKVDFVYLIAQFGEGEETVAIIDNRDALAKQDHERVQRQILQNPLLRAKNNNHEISEVAGQPNPTIAADTATATDSSSDSAPTSRFV